MLQTEYIFLQNKIFENYTNCYLMSEFSYVTFQAGFKLRKVLSIYKIRVNKRSSYYNFLAEVYWTVCCQGDPELAKYRVRFKVSAIATWQLHRRTKCIIVAYAESIVKPSNFPS